MAFTREQIRESVERAGDAHWQALIRHHEDAYPASRPPPGEVARQEAERLNAMGLGEGHGLAGFTQPWIGHSKRRVPLSSPRKSASIE